MKGCCKRTMRSTGNGRRNGIHRLRMENTSRARARISNRFKSFPSKRLSFSCSFALNRAVLLLRLLALPPCGCVGTQQHGPLRCLDWTASRTAVTATLHCLFSQSQNLSSTSCCTSIYQMNKLPAELLSDIVDVACSNFEEKDSAQLLCNLCLTSQILRLICQPKLFSSISATTNSSLRRLLQQDARLASYVRRIEMIWLYPRNADAADRARVEDWKGGQLADLASLCSDCQNLDSIELDCRPATSWIDEEASIHGWKAQEPSAALFQQVTSLTVRSQSAVDDPTANGLFLLALLPQVTNLRISCPYTSVS